MNKYWFDRLNEFEGGPANIIWGHQLSNTTDRTLIYGYTCDRRTFHVYIKNKIIYTVIYNVEYSRAVPVPKNMVQVQIRSNNDYIPDKRVYPERSDYEFCKLLKRHEIDIPFTAWSDEVDPDGTYYGFILEDAQ